jgi:hypothetical protein
MTPPALMLHPRSDTLVELLDVNGLMETADVVE